MSEHPKENSDSRPENKAGSAPMGNGELVLVVDDDCVQRRLAQRLLEKLGYVVAVVSSGEEAVSVVRDKPHDVILLDMVMDGIDGAETLRRIKDLYPDQSAILFSGYASNDRVHQAMAVGAREFLSKPVKIDALAYAMHRALRQPADSPTPEN